MYISVPPSLDSRFMRDFKSSAGDRVKAEALFVGEPTPEIVWTRESPDGNVKVVATDKSKEVAVTVDEASTKLVLNSVLKSQEGRYTVRAENENGSATASFSVTVRDRPDPPRGFTAARGDAGGWVLSWKRPEEDGGCAIDFYQVNTHTVLVPL